MTHMITRPQTFLIATSDDAPADCQWAYRTPFSVTLTVPNRWQAIDWVFSLELLADGLHHGPQDRAGVGDVQIWSVGDEVFIQLTSPNGRAVLCGDWSVAAGFVDAIYDTAPDGFRSVEEWESKTCGEQIDVLLSELSEEAAS